MKKKLELYTSEVCRQEKRSLQLKSYKSRNNRLAFRGHCQANTEYWACPRTRLLALRICALQCHRRHLQASEKTMIRSNRTGGYQTLMDASPETNTPNTRLEVDQGVEPLPQDLGTVEY